MELSMMDKVLFRVFVTYNGRGGVMLIFDARMRNASVGRYWKDEDGAYIFQYKETLQRPILHVDLDRDHLGNTQYYLKYWVVKESNHYQFPKKVIPILTKTGLGLDEQW